MLYCNDNDDNNNKAKAFDLFVMKHVVNSAEIRTYTCIKQYVNLSFTYSCYAFLQILTKFRAKTVT